MGRLLMFMFWLCALAGCVGVVLIVAGDWFGWTLMAVGGCGVLAFSEGDI